jgi:hypothetical protein
MKEMILLYPIYVIRSMVLVVDDVIQYYGMYLHDSKRNEIFGVVVDWVCWIVALSPHEPNARQESFNRCEERIVTVFRSIIQQTQSHQTDRLKCVNDFANM